MKAQHAHETVRFSPEERHSTLLIGSAWRGSIGEMVDEEMEREKYEPLDDEAYVPYVPQVAEDTHYHAVACIPQAVITEADCVFCEQCWEDCEQDIGDRDPNGWISSIRKWYSRDVCHCCATTTGHRAE